MLYTLQQEKMTEDLIQSIGAKQQPEVTKTNNDNNSINI